MSQKVRGHEDVIDGLIRVYRDVIVPLEQASQFQLFHRLFFSLTFCCNFNPLFLFSLSPPLRDSDFASNPLVLLLG